jgi:hypothetical protein
VRDFPGTQNSAFRSQIIHLNSRLGFVKIWHELCGVFPKAISPKRVLGDPQDAYTRELPTAIPHTPLPVH